MIVEFGWLPSPTNKREDTPSFAASAAAGPVAVLPFPLPPPVSPDPEPVLPEPPGVLDTPEPLPPDGLAAPAVALDADGPEELPPPQPASASAARQTTAQGCTARNFCKMDIHSLGKLTLF